MDDITKKIMGAMLETTYRPIIIKAVSLFAMHMVYDHLDPTKSMILQLQVLQRDSIKLDKLANNFTKKSEAHTETMVEEILRQYKLKPADDELLFYYQEMGKMIIEETIKVSHLIGKGYLSSLKQRTC